MTLSALADKSQEPSDEKLAVVLGPAKTTWDDFCNALSTEYPPLTAEWTFAGKKWGWSLRLKRGKRAIVYLTPSEGSFFAGFALGEKAVARAQQSELPASILEVIDSAEKYAEGRAVRLEIRSPDQIGHVLAIASAKMRT